MGVWLCSSTHQVPDGVSPSKGDPTQAAGADNPLKLEEPNPAMLGTICLLKSTQQICLM